MGTLKLNYIFNQIAKMKIAATLVSFALAGNAPPPESKTCPDCTAFTAATVDFMNGTQGNIANSWLNLVNEACLMAPANQQQICQIVQDIGFTNVLNNMLSMDPKDFCGDLTFCKNIRAAMFEETAPTTAHCKPCLNMVDDIISITQNDADHFDQIWTALTKQMCSQGIGKAEQKFCFKELGDAQDGAREFMAKQDSKAACEAIYYC